MCRQLTYSLPRPICQRTACRLLLLAASEAFDTWCVLFLSSITKTEPISPHSSRGLGLLTLCCLAPALHQPFTPSSQEPPCQLITHVKTRPSLLSTVWAPRNSPTTDRHKLELFPNLALPCPHSSGQSSSRRQWLVSSCFKTRPLPKYILYPLPLDSCNILPSYAHHPPITSNVTTFFIVHHGERPVKVTTGRRR